MSSSKNSLLCPFAVGLSSALLLGGLGCGLLPKDAAPEPSLPAGEYLDPGGLVPHEGELVDQAPSPSHLHKPIRHKPRSEVIARQNRVWQAQSSPTAVDLPDALYLRRLSLSLRNRLPLESEYDDLENAVASGGGEAFFAAKIDEYLADDNFGEVMMDLHNDALQLDVGIMAFLGVPKLDDPPPFDDAGTYFAGDWWTVQQMSQSLMKQPLHLIRDIIENDEDYRNIVRSPTTMANGVVDSVWDVEGYTGAGQFDWQRVDRNVGHQKPAAGILVDNIVYLRHASAGFNYNRGRANLFTKALVCRDFLDSDVPVTNIDLSDENAVQQALTQNPLCVSCHQGIDAIARNFDQFRNNPNPALIRRHNEDSYPWWFSNRWNFHGPATGRDPNWFGEPTTSLADLGQKIGDDPRFSLCTAKRFYSYFLQIPLDDVPLEVASPLQVTLINSGFNARSLTRAVVSHPSFRKYYDPGVTTEDPLVGYRRMRPPAMGRMFKDLTLFDWEGVSVVQWPAARMVGNTLTPTTLAGPYFIHINNWRNGPLGYRVLGGGVDAQANVIPVDTVNPTTIMMLRRAAQEQAYNVVALDFGFPSIETNLLDPLLGLEGSTGETEVREAIAELHLRLYGERVDPDGPEVDDWYAFWQSALPSGESSVDFWLSEDLVVPPPDGGPGITEFLESIPRPEAWTALLSVMFADPRMLFF